MQLAGPSLYHTRDARETDVPPLALPFGKQSGFLQSVGNNLRIDILSK